MSISLDDLNAGIFAAHLHTTFALQREGAAPLVLELIEVKDSDPSPRIELFTLHFRGPAQPRMAQHIHRLEHEMLGTMEIFLTAIAGDGDGITYESVFHRFRKTAPSAASRMLGCCKPRCPRITTPPRQLLAPACRTLPTTHGLQEKKALATFIRRLARVTFKCTHSPFPLPAATFLITT